VHWAAAGFSNAEWDGNACISDFPDSQLQVGYTHFIDRSVLFPDAFWNCVYETAARFDVSPLSQYPGAVITSASVRYDEQIIKLRTPDGYEPVYGTPDVFPDAAVGTCVGSIGVPSQEWSGSQGLIPNDTDETLQRFAGAVWEIIHSS
jgi:hypothetical protein